MKGDQSIEQISVGAMTLADPGLEKPSYYQVIHAQAIMEFPFSKQEPTHTRSVLITGIPIFS